MTCRSRLYDTLVERKSIRAGNQHLEIPVSRNKLPGVVLNYSALFFLQN